MSSTGEADTPAELTLIIGGPGSGKSTYLVQLFGRLQEGSSVFSLVDAPESLGPVRDGLNRLAQGLPVRHTSTGAELVQELKTVRNDGAEVRVSIPDYPGEAVDELVARRRVPSRWRDLAVESARWLLFIRVEQMPELPGLPAREVSPTRSPDLRRELPMDIRLVELLQILRHERQRHKPSASEMPDLTIVLSCWDEITDKPDGVAPVSILHERVPLMHSYAEANWEPAHLSVVGLSAQGLSLDESNPNARFIDLGPESMGILVRQDGMVTGDLTELLAR